MIQTVLPGARQGKVKAPASKSMAHRHLICAFLTGGETRIFCPEISKDIEATVNCLKGFGAKARFTKDEIILDARDALEAPFTDLKLPCKESGSTLRFLLPVAGALHKSACFLMEGRLPERPMEEYENVLREHGMEINRDKSRLYCKGQLLPGTFVLPGNISSQYFSGLLFALPLLSGESVLKVEGKLESADYVRMTENALMMSGISWEMKENEYRIPGNQRYCMPGFSEVEGDYSQAAFFLCAGAFSEEGITVSGLSAKSGQGDKRILSILEQFGAKVTVSGEQVTVCRGNLRGISIDASMIPDLIPVLGVLAAGAEGKTRIYHAERLRLKESDRIRSTFEMLKNLGALVEETEDGLIIKGQKELCGKALIDPENDHRIAMSAAVGSCICRETVTIKDAQCVEKSYPDFWNVFCSLQRKGTDV